MGSDKPCTACSWTVEHQDYCSYKSHVKLFYGLSDRGCWSLGDTYILKDRSNNNPNFESINIQFLQQHTTVPVPKILKDWTEESGRYFLIMERMQGQLLKDAWADIDHVAQQTIGYLSQLRSLRSDKIHSLKESPIYSAFLFRNGYGVPHGPLASDGELWHEMSKALTGVPDNTRTQLQQRMPPAEPYTFTHGDLTNTNIIVRDFNLVGIVDWEASGYFPVWWEYRCAKLLARLLCTQQEKHYAVLLLEGPGQGLLLKKSGLPLRPDFEVCAVKVLGFLENLARSRPELQLDLDRIAVAGAVTGGYFALRAATDARVKACVSIDPFFSIFELAMTRAPQSFVRLSESGWVTDDLFNWTAGLQSWISFQARWELALGVSSMGVESPAAMLRRFEDFSLVRHQEGREGLGQGHVPRASHGTRRGCRDVLFGRDWGGQDPQAAHHGTGEKQGTLGPGGGSRRRVIGQHWSLAPVGAEKLPISRQAFWD
ncbi:hypothetical protein TOPH_07044 [Tolypocladium ophioglossoides CBS 100239]|uniref:Aminoglycoside phosphotransferase domain-containing protein n=1 Tax=Tolypocladium ophioglossoides (strain CBS 100239) TaxID=1163406 RepID=A0A0L0N2M5_TOLOC|nr:hypothetical protein TOPH_07044 [Tolypocladium ophioglossoides CBS 100239]